MLSAGLMAWLWYLYSCSAAEHNAAVADGGTGSTAIKRNKNMFLAMAIGWQLVGILLVILLLIMHSRIKMVVALFEESSRCIASMPLLLVLPVMSLLLGGITVLYFLCIGLFLISASEQVLLTSAVLAPRFEGGVYL
jgi:hypothetical protein